MTDQADRPPPWRWGPGLEAEARAAYAELQATGGYVYPPVKIAGTNLWAIPRWTVPVMPGAPPGGLTGPPMTDLELRAAAYQALTRAEHEQARRRAVRPAVASGVQPPAPPPQEAPAGAVSPAWAENPAHPWVQKRGKKAPPAPAGPGLI